MSVSVSNALFADAAARQLEITRPDTESDKGDSGRQSYWRKPDGTIVFLSCTANGLKSYTKKKFTLLPDYGEFTTAFDSARRLDIMVDPYRLILERGGIKEFSREQIVELGWHRTPHVILRHAISALIGSGLSESEAMLAVMPQLRDFERVDVPCKLCPGRVFNSESELEHHEILHREDVQTRRMTDGIAKAIAGAQAGQTESFAPILQMLAQAIQTLADGQADQRLLLDNITSMVKGSATPAPAKK